MKRIVFIVCLIVFSTLLMVTWMSPAALAKEKEIRIGVMGPLKFGSGIDMLAGAELGFKKINDEGGVLVGGVRHKFSMIKADTNEYLSVTDAVNTIERLITLNKVHFLIGCHRTEATLAQMEVMADYKILLLNVQSASPKINERLAKNYDKYKYWFRLGALNAV